MENAGAPALFLMLTDKSAEWKREGRACDCNFLYHRRLPACACTCAAGAGEEFFLLWLCCCCCSSRPFSLLNRALFSLSSHPSLFSHFLWLSLAPLSIHACLLPFSRFLHTLTRCVSLAAFGDRAKIARSFLSAKRKQQVAHSPSPCDDGGVMLPSCYASQRLQSHFKIQALMRISMQIDRFIYPSDPLH